MQRDAYLRWKSQSKKDRQQQLRADSGARGHIREPRHAGQMAIEILLEGERYMVHPVDANEAWALLHGDGVPLDVARMRERLPAALEAARARGLRMFGDRPYKLVEDLEQFVELAEAIEAEHGQVGVFVPWE